MPILAPDYIEHMPRTKCHRFIESDPKTNYFKPRGIPMKFLEEINLELDEFEAIRLRNYDGLYQEKAAEKMKISRLRSLIYMPLEMLSVSPRLLQHPWNKDAER